MIKQETEIDAIWSEYKQTSNLNLRNQIIEHYSWLVNYAISQMNLPKNIIIDSEDFRSFGMIALIDSI